MDITLDDMKEIFRVLSERLQSTTGDKATYTKLEDIRLILQKTQTDINKNDPKANAQLIAKTVADAISAKLAVLNNQNTAKPNIVDLVNDEVKSAQQGLVREIQLITTALGGLRTSIGTITENIRSSSNGSPGSAGNNKNTQDNQQSKSGINTTTLTTKALMLNAARELYDAAQSGGRFAANQLKESVDSYRKLQSLGQSFSGPGDNGAGSIIAMRKTVESAGMSMESFTKALEYGNSGLRQLGGNQFATLSINLRNSMKDVANFGMTVDQTNNALSDYVETQKYTRGVESINSMSVNAGFREMMTSVTGLSGALGASQQEIIKTTAQSAKNPNLQALLSGVSNEKARDEIERTYNAYGASGNEAAQKTLLNGLRNLIKPTQESGEAYAANRVGMEGVQKALQATINSDADLLSGLKQAGQAGEAADKRAGPVVYAADSSSSALQAITEQRIANRQLSATNLQGRDAALAAANQQTPETNAVLRLNESESRIKAFESSLVTTLIDSTKQTATVFMNSFNDVAQNQLVPLAANIDKLADSVRNLDGVIAGKLKDLGPEGTLAIGGAALAAAELAKYVALGYAAKQTLNLAKSILGTVSKAPVAGGLARAGAGGLMRAGAGLAADLALPLAGGVAAHETLSAVDPDDKLGMWMDKNVFLASRLDNLFSHVGLGRSYEEQRRVDPTLVTPDMPSTTQRTETTPPSQNQTTPPAQTAPARSTVRRRGGRNDGVIQPTPATPTETTPPQPAVTPSASNDNLPHTFPTTPKADTTAFNEAAQRTLAAEEKKKAEDKAKEDAAKAEAETPIGRVATAMERQITLMSQLIEMTTKQDETINDIMKQIESNTGDTSRGIRTNRNRSQ